LKGFDSTQALPSELNNTFSLIARLIANLTEKLLASVG